MERPTKYDLLRDILNSLGYEQLISTEVLILELSAPLASTRAMLSTVAKCKYITRVGNGIYKKLIPIPNELTYTQLTEKAYGPRPQIKREPGFWCKPKKPKAATTFSKIVDYLNSTDQPFTVESAILVVEAPRVTVHNIIATFTSAKFLKWVSKDEYQRILPIPVSITTYQLRGMVYYRKHKPVIY